MKAVRAVHTGRQRLEALDGLRGIAILLVLADHVILTVVTCPRCGSPARSSAAAAFYAAAAGAGAAGVMLFFALSGFLLFLPYAQSILAPPAAAEDNRNRWPGARGFYVRRMRRILPAYYLLCVLLFVTPWLVAGLQLHVSPAQLPWASLLAAFGLVFDLNRQLFSAVTWWDGSLWSLTVEWQFYLILPFLALVLRRVASRGEWSSRVRRLVLGLAMLMAAGLAVRCVAAWLHYSLGYADPAGDAPGIEGVALALLYGVKGKYLEVFAVGMLASALYVAQPRALIRRISGLVSCAPWLGGVGLSLCGLWGAAGGFASGGQLTGYWLPATALGWTWSVFGQWVIGLCGAALLLAALVPTMAGRRAVGHRTWHWNWRDLCACAPLRGLGAISYSLYLWHAPFIGAVYGPAPLPPVTAALRLALGVALAIAFAYASYRLIERPFLAPRRLHVSAESVPAVASVPISATQRR